jgi:hypothetical protein
MGPMAELSDLAVELATGANTAYLATLNADGALKERNVRRDPRVAVSIWQEGNPYRKVDIRVAEAEHDPETGGRAER